MAQLDELISMRRFCWKFLWIFHATIYILRKPNTFEQSPNLISINLSYEFFWYFFGILRIYELYENLRNISWKSKIGKLEYFSKKTSNPLCIAYQYCFKVDQEISYSYNFVFFSSEKLSLKKKVYTCTNCKVHFHSSKLVFNFRSLILLSKSRQGRRKGWKMGGGKKW